MPPLHRTPLLTAALTHATAFVLVVGTASAKQPAPSPLPAASVLLRPMTAGNAMKVPGIGPANSGVPGPVRAAADGHLGRLLRGAVCTGC